MGKRSSKGSAMTDRRFGLRNALSLLWHLSNNWGHGRTLFYDVRADAVRCGCGKKWGAR